VNCRTGYRKKTVGDLLQLHNAHEQAQLLLPWRVNGTLDPGESALLDAHLAQCEACREDLAANLALRRLYAAVPAGHEPSRSPQPLRADGGRHRASNRIVRQFVKRRTRWSTVVQGAVAAAAVVALVVAFSPPSTEGEYRLLGSDSAEPAGNAIVLFSPETPERDLRAALSEVDARLVDGPTASGAYVVRVPGNKRADALARLRSVPQVILAEPIDAGDPQ
jgi:hypothetical protein